MSSIKRNVFLTIGLTAISTFSFSGGGSPDPKPKPKPQPPVIDSIEYNGDILISNRVVKGIPGHVGLYAIGYGYEFHGKRGAAKDVLEATNVGNTHIVSESTLDAFQSNGFVGFNGILEGSSHSYSDKNILSATLFHHEQSNLVHLYIDSYQAMDPADLFGDHNPFPYDPEVFAMPDGVFVGNYVRIGRFRNDGYVKHLIARMDDRHVNDPSWRSAGSAYALQNATMSRTRMSRTFMTKQDTVGIRQ